MSSVLLIWQLFYMLIVRIDGSIVELKVYNEFDKTTKVFKMSHETAIHWSSAVFEFCSSEKMSAQDCFLIHSRINELVSGLEDNVFLSPTETAWSMILPPDVEIAPTDDLIKRFNHANKSIAIIGAEGYIGSHLHECLHELFTVTGYSNLHRLPNSPGLKIVNMKSNQISDSAIQSYDVIIYMGGLTGRRACDSVSVDIVFQENVLDPYYLASKMSATQLFIFASSAAVAEGSGANSHKEDDAISAELDTYAESMRRREYAMKHLAQSGRGPVMVGLRFGTVVGTSRGQRTDLLHMALLRSAYTNGYVEITDPQMYRPILSLEDLGRAITRVIQDATKLKNRVEIFNLQSTSSTVESVAHEVASQTGVYARIVGRSTELMEEVSTRLDNTGFTLDPSKFEDMFDFRFKGTSKSMIAGLIQNLPESISPKGSHAIVSRVLTDSIPCPVCGSTHQQELIDLHEQPYANSFRPTAEEALAAPRYPLKLIRCKSCNHIHLGSIADRKELFEHYLYQSNTSATLLEYFEWLAERVIAESSSPSNGTVIELACNDGSQLDSFKARGWRTYGVDPAENLVPLAREKGHRVELGFWGSPHFDMSKLPPPEEVDAIVAQNVFGHVDAPVEFLKACAKAMSAKTKLYIQTSQCEMLQKGQFDTAYHEHVSFFTGHSFFKAAQLSGLHMSKFEETPVHGTSCFITYELATGGNKTIDVPGQSVQERLRLELADGLDTDAFYTQYTNRAHGMRDWMIRHLRALSAANYTIGAYGAAAKGIVLLHFISDGVKLDLDPHGQSFKLNFIVDDATLKRGMYAPGTDIPVWPTNKLTEIDPNDKLAVVVLAWNFWPEIAKKLKIHLKGKRRNVVCILPFPEPKVVNLEIPGFEVDIDGNEDSSVVDSSSQVVARLTVIDLPKPQEKRRKIVLVSHFFNEELLLPYWIRHHARYFDEAILIDYDSTDRSVEIVRKQAPAGWRVVSSRHKEFDHVLVDKEVMWYESKFKDAWKISLCITEFLMAKDLRSLLRSYELQDEHLFTWENYSAILRVPAVSIVGHDTKPLNPNEPLVKQRSVYGLLNQTKVDMQELDRGAEPFRLIIWPAYNRPAGTNIYSRHLHVGLSQHEFQYAPGRHDAAMLHERHDLYKLIKDAFIMKFMWTPWPEVAPRKVQIGSKVKRKSTLAGFQHLFVKNNLQRAENLRHHVMNGVDFYDLNEILADGLEEGHEDFHRIYQEVVDGTPTYAK